MRCGAPGTSWHVTAKSSICVGVCFINLASTRRKLCVLPREVCRLFALVRTPTRTGLGESRADRPAEVSRGHSRSGKL